jgi:hypothetical protein
MNCTEARELLDLRPLGLLDPEDEAALDQQLEGCADCRAHAVAVEGAFAEIAASNAAERRPLSEGLRTDLMAGLDDPQRVDAAPEVGKKKQGLAAAPTPENREAVEAIARQITVACAYCHDGATRDQMSFCASCLAPHHADCFELNKGCSVMGCDAITTVRPGHYADKPLVVTRGGKGSFVWGALFTLVAGGGIAAMNGVTLTTTRIQSDTQPYTVPVRPSGSPPEPAAPEPLPKVDPMIWLRAFEAERTTALDELRRALETQDHAKIDDAITSVERLCRAALSPAPHRREAIRKLLRDAEALFPAPEVAVGRLPTQLSATGRIDVEFEDVDLADVMEQIGRQMGRTILVDPDVEEVVRVSFRDIPWMEAVYVIARMTRCDVEERPGGILLLTQPPVVTLQFNDANVHTVLRLLAAYSGKNIVIGSGVRGTVTVDLKEVHWLRALHAIARTAGDVEVIELEDDLILVQSIDQYASYEGRALDLGAAIEQLRDRNAPGPRVSLEMGGTLAEVCAALAKESGMAIDVDSGVARHESLYLRINLKTVHWREALAAIAKSSNLELIDRPSGALLSGRKEIALGAYRAPIVLWLKFLNRAGGLAWVVPSTLSGRVELQVSNVTIDQVVETTARIMDLRWRRVLGVAEITPGRTTAPHVEPFKPMRISLPAGEFLDLTLEGSIETPDPAGSFALISGRIYTVGERIVTDATAQSVTISKIEDDCVTLNVGDAVVGELSCTYEVEGDAEGDAEDELKLDDD